MHIKKAYKCEGISLKSPHDATHDMAAIENDVAKIKERGKRTVAQLLALTKKYGGASAGGEVILAMESDNIFKYEQGDVFFTSDYDLALDGKYDVKTRAEGDKLEKQMEQEMAAIPGVLSNRARVYTSNYGNGTTFRLQAVIGHIEFDQYIRNDFDIPKDISLEEFSRKYIGAKSVNKRAENECRIVGCGTLDDGTEYVAYQSYGSAAAKKKLITPLKNFVRNFVAPPEGKRPNGTPMDISEFSGVTYTTKMTPHPAHVIGSFIDYSGADCLVLDSPDSTQRYSWATLDDFNKRYTPVSESRRMPPRPYSESFGEKMSWSRFASALNKSPMGWDWDTEWYGDGLLSLSVGAKTLDFRISWEDQGDEDRYDIPHTLMGVKFAPEEAGAVPENVISEINSARNIPALVKALHAAVLKYGT